MVITGHYHNSDEFEREGVRYLNPGSISSSGNMKTDPSVWILDTEDLSYEQVKIPCAISLKRSEPKDINDYLSKIEAEDIYRIKVGADASIDRKLLLKAKRKALDLQLQLNVENMKSVKKEKIDTFWDYVGKNKKEYLDDFKTVYESVKE